MFPTENVAYLHYGSCGQEGSFFRLCIGGVILLADSSSSTARCFVLIKLLKTVTEYIPGRLQTNLANMLLP